MVLPVRVSDLGQTVTFTPPVNSKSFTVTRTPGTQSTTIPTFVTDGCGPQETFVGMGPTF